MSPPIRDGSGSSIGSIRLGDGSEISEVRTGAGDVLFSAIPDSVVNNLDVWYPMGEGSGTSLADGLGTVDATFGAATWQSDPTFTQNDAIVLDGTDDEWVSDSTVARSTSNMSICGWFNPEQYRSNDGLGGMTTTQTPFSGSGGCVTLRDGGSVRGWCVDAGNGGSAGEVTVGTTNEWHFFGWNADLSTADGEMYVWDNSSLVGENVGNGIPAKASDVFLSGGFSGQGFFDGLHDAVGFALDVRLTQSEFNSIRQDTQR